MASVWGGDSPSVAWGHNAWASNTITYSLTGLSATATVGSVLPLPAPAWGTLNWGENGWGTVESATEIVTGFSITGTLNSGGITTTQLTIASPTGLSITGTINSSLTLNYDMINFAFTGPAAMSAGIGVPNINDGSDHTQGVGSLLATGSLGSLSHEMAYDLTGLSSTMSLNAAGMTVDDTQLITITASLLTTGSLGSSVTVSDMAVGLSGLQATGSVGAITPADIVLGLTGLSATGSLGTTGLSTLGYKDIDLTGNTSYTYVTHVS